ncbi:hypothetical protein KC343_g8957 [Hortaea werneckii]|nr:hypothetical protein KC352_g17773 [Hortaea werneckii]KAI7567900.1 hypothetical protein KC317_g4662 [Hortaea werneckii]KAI7609383.1 hypothetical protein KC346_g9211 [Hortaea werneckii]KAI7618799.1 hypothetical protein KC343_g8957 [Hortaea werneckii]KAI7660069.1 hypothetical protein KC319_g8754 [Hortaea werneckii]
MLPNTAPLAGRHRHPVIFGQTTDAPDLTIVGEVFRREKFEVQVADAGTSHPGGTQRLFAVGGETEQKMHEIQGPVQQQRAGRTQ